MHTQRVEPCFKAPPSCDHGMRSYELAMYFNQNEATIMNTCDQLIEDVFQLERIGILGVNLTGFDMATNWTALAEIPEGSKFCEDARKYISMCTFCGTELYSPCDYQEDLPSCDDYVSFEPSWEHDTFVNREFMCSRLDSFFFSLGDDVFNETLRDETMKYAFCFPGESEAFREAYPHCYFCSASMKDTDRSFNGFGSQDPVEFFDSTDINVEESCTAIESVLHGDPGVIYWMAGEFKTWDLYVRARQVVPEYCLDLAASCFNETYPPECLENPDDLPPETDEDAIVINEFWDALMLYEGYMSEGYMSIPSYHLDGLRYFRASHPLCPKIREAYSHGWWCDYEENIDYENTKFCSRDYCSEYDSFQRAPYVPYNGTEQEEFQEYCDRARRLYAEEVDVGATIELCRGQQKFAEGCLCVKAEDRNIAPDYLGADTTSKKKSLVWCSRIAAVLSFLGACYIVHDVYSNTKKHIKVYHQLVLGMVFFDLVTALAWSFGTLPINDEVSYEVFGAHGTDVSCRAQGFFIQLGFTSIFYNVSLAIYFYLIIARGWKETQLRKICPWFHVPPILVGLVLAFVALPYYNGFDYACHLLPHPSGDLWKVLVFAVVPIGFSILFISLVMMCMYLVVRAQSRASSKWSFRFGQSAKMEKMVFWQALFYTMSFYITWPIVLCVYVTGWDFEKKIFGFSLVVSLVAPLQGFNNSLVYSRPRIAERLGDIFNSTIISGALSSVFGASTPFSDRGNLGVPEQHCSPRRGRRPHREEIEGGEAKEGELKIEEDGREKGYAHSSDSRGLPDANKLDSLHLDQCSEYGLVNRNSIALSIDCSEK